MARIDKNHFDNSDLEYLKPKNNNTFTVTIKAQDLDCILRVIKVINNCIYEECGIVSEYNQELITALLGKNWDKEYSFGKKYME